MPEAIRPDVIAHMDYFVAPESDALMFTMLRGGPMRRGNFNPLVKWARWYPPSERLIYDSTIYVISVILWRHTRIELAGLDDAHGS